MTDNDLLASLRGALAEQSENILTDLHTGIKSVKENIVGTEKRLTARADEDRREMRSHYRALADTVAEMGQQVGDVKAIAESAKLTAERAETAAKKAREALSDHRELAAKEASEHDLEAEAKEGARITAERIMQSQVGALADGFGQHKTAVAQELAVIKHQISQNTSLTQQGFASTSKGRKTRTVAGSLTAIGAIIIAVSEIIKVIVPAAAATNKQVPTHQVSP